MAEYILDLSEAVLPSWWPPKTTKAIPVCDGKWFKRYDVIEDRVPGFRGKMLLALKRNFIDHYNATTIGLPLGFELYDLPPGSELLKLGIVRAAQGKGE